MSYGGRSHGEDDDHRGRDRGQRRRSRFGDDGFGPQPDPYGAPPPDMGRPYPPQRAYPSNAPAPQHRPSAGPTETVTARVKWYNPEKGFGFVQVDGREKDPFLHASALQSSGIQSLAPGATLVCEIAETQRGSAVQSIVSVDESTADPSTARRDAPYGRPQGADRGMDRGRYPMRPAARQPAVAERTLVATVKWFDAVRGFGFFSDPETGADLFVHASALQSAGLRSVGEGESYRVGVGRNAKGPCVVSVERA